MEHMLQGLYGVDAAAVRGRFLVTHGTRALSSSSSSRGCGWFNPKSTSIRHSAVLHSKRKSPRSMAGNQKSRPRWSGVRL